MSCGIDDVFHFEGEPQRCFYCLDPLILTRVDEFWDECAGCGLRYQAGLVAAYGTERVLSQPDRYHVSRMDVPRPVVTITDLDVARSVLAQRGDE